MEKILYDLKEVDMVNQIVVTIEGDVNDGDYVTTINKFEVECLDNDDEFMFALKALVDIKSNRGLNGIRHNWEDKEDLLKAIGTYSDEQIECLIDNHLLTEIFTIPSDDYGYCHSITDIIIDIYKDKKKYELIFK